MTCLGHPWTDPLRWTIAVPATRTQAQIREEGRQALSDAEDLDRAAISLQADIYRGQVHHGLRTLVRTRSENLQCDINSGEGVLYAANCSAGIWW